MELCFNLSDHKCGTYKVRYMVTYLVRHIQEYKEKITEGWRQMQIQKLHDLYVVFLLNTYSTHTYTKHNALTDIFQLPAVKLKNNC
jgi:hypothetical protein